MAGLASEEVRKLLKNNTALQDAVSHEQRLKMHIDPIFHAGQGNAAFTRFKTWVRSLLYADKYEKWENLLPYPLSTNELTEEIFSQLSRVFEADNRYFNIQFSSPDHENDFAEFRSRLEDDKTFRTEIWEHYKTCINGFIVIDLPNVQEGDRPEPYFYFLHLDKVAHVKVKEDGDVERILFCTAQSEDLKEYLYIDADCYQVIYDRDGVISTEEAVPHFLEYCPVTSIARQIIPGTQNLNKLSPVTKSLGELDWYLFFKTSKKYLDLYAPYPIYTRYEERCDYHDERGECDGHGVFMFNDISQGTVTDCPACKQRGGEFIGAGSLVSIEPPKSKDDADLSKPIGIVPADIDSVEYVEKEVQRLKDSIFTACVGADTDQKNDQAKNEKQIQSSFESKQNVLEKIKEDFEAAHAFVLETVARYRYPDTFVSVSVDYGSKFYLKSSEDARSDYQAAKELGLPSSYLQSTREELFYTTNRNNPEERERMRILTDLEPWADQSLKECKELELHRMFPDEFYLKLNFNSLIAQFEAQNGDVLTFGEALSYDRKLQRIKEWLKSQIVNPKIAEDE